MLTLDNHLTGVTADRPHPDGYRPDLPLKGEVSLATVAWGKGYDKGYREGREDMRHDTAANERRLREENATLRRQIEAKRA